MIVEGRIGNSCQYYSWGLGFMITVTSAPNPDSTSWGPYFSNSGLSGCVIFWSFRVYRLVILGCSGCAVQSHWFYLGWGFWDFRAWGFHGLVMSRSWWQEWCPFWYITELCEARTNPRTTRFRVLGLADLGVICLVIRYPLVTLRIIFRRKEDHL